MKTPPNKKSSAGRYFQGLLLPSRVQYVIYVVIIGLSVWRVMMLCFLFVKKELHRILTLQEE